MVSSRIFPAPQDRRRKVQPAADKGPYVAPRLRRRPAAVNESIDASRWNQYDFGERITAQKPTSAGGRKSVKIKKLAPHGQRARGKRAAGHSEISE
jgi:hypothetical protein